MALHRKTEKIKGSYSTQRSNAEPEHDQEHYFFLFSALLLV